MSTSIYQHPLAYLLGMEGLALLRGWAGDVDEAFVRDRLAEVRRLVDDPVLASHPGVNASRGTTVEAYRQWASTYDEPNGLFDADEPFIHDVLDGISAGTALDAACGSGRFAAGLVRRGHRVVGVDSSPEMLAVARRRVPEAQLELGDLTALPLAGGSVDVVVCALALSHVSELDRALAEFARVLRPGGHLIVSDVHPELILRGSVVPSTGPHGEPGLAPTYRHTTGAFLRAALPQGFVVLRCEEPGAAATGTAESSPPAPGASLGSELGTWSEWPWSLVDLVPAAADAAWQVPATINWHLRMPS